MCEKYGNGGKWYLNPENYARRLYKIRKEANEASGIDADPQSAGMGAGVVSELVKARISGDLAWEQEIKKDA
ncbi:MAG TPA: 4Fe-4S ferredoxin, partial [Verrucomicrobiae bacterium]|nr:4Fe-4S ferredoxin [Verrucomicrobiae bacterium]